MNGCDGKNSLWLSSLRSHNNNHNSNNDSDHTQSPAQSPPPPTAAEQSHIGDVKQEESPAGHNHDTQTNTNTHTHVHTPIQTQTHTATTHHTTTNGNATAAAGQSSEIDALVDIMTHILQRLRERCHTRNTHHAMDLARFQKLIEWVDYNVSHLALLEQAWEDQRFWPFLSTAEAEARVRADQDLMIVRLSNTTPGAITVTQSEARPTHNNQLEHHPKNKRYFPSPHAHGKLQLVLPLNERKDVTWDGLLAHLMQKECSICLEELREHEVYRINCGHHFHRTCIERHIEHSGAKQQTAVCPLCRQSIKYAEVWHEKHIKHYKKVPAVPKAKSADTILVTQPPHRHHQDASIKRAATTDNASTNKNAFVVIQQPAAAAHGDDEDGHASGNDDVHASTTTTQHPLQAQWQFGTHLDVSWNSTDDTEDEYGNAAQARQLAMAAMAGTHVHQ
eukprot:CAMPEP_0202701082 /NCGR_PEP_ID=MMETSP1385-20130828/14175_1 /ASSEMBLY_ACC=CAM_ASM_000861 /TAXON_ID=933848 /ORGANISM="Elphidium margaritaceum" /LENGTH=447 /DNA_ID=CAMNT_0049358403 /DNA_START=169 /DNA_END=1512 /DNA_ORIENTATION=+